MNVAALVVSIVAAMIAGAAVLYARQQAQAAKHAVDHAKTSADAATRSADLAEVVEAGRHYGWRLEPRANYTHYTLRNVGTVNAKNVSLSGDFHSIGFPTSEGTTCDIAAGQARLVSLLMAYGDRGGEIHITWTPDLPHAQPMTWTEMPPILRNSPTERDL